MVPVKNKSHIINILLLFLLLSTTIASADEIEVDFITQYGESIYDVAVVGNYAYIANHENGLAIMDISDPSSPTLVGSCDTAGTAWDVVVSGNYAYIADHNGGLAIVDISNPASPVVTGTCGTTGNALGVFVSGNYAYLADYANGISIVDINNPSSPKLVGTYDLAGDAWDISVVNNYAYVADTSNGLVILDVSNPESPNIVSNYNCNAAYDVAVKDNYAYVADQNSGLIILDVTDPSSPTRVSSYDEDTFAHSICVSENYAYVSEGKDGILILNVSNPALPKFAGSYDTVEYVNSVAVADSYAYIANVNNGFVILHLSATLEDTTDTSDITPPAPITDLQENNVGESWIHWTWTNPNDADFKYSMIYLDGIFITNTSDEYYNFTGLDAGTAHTLSIKTVDNSGNINQEWTNDSAITATVSESPTTIPTISELSGKDITTNSITLTWTNSADVSKVDIYRNNVLLGNVTGATSYMDSNLASDTTYSYTLIPYNANGLAGESVSVSLKSKSSGGGGGGGSSDKKSNSGGGGGGAGSAEDFENVAMKDVDNEYLGINANVTYEFSREGNPIHSVSFYSLKNSGEITSTVELLNSRSKFANSTPDGFIYKYINIWVGKAGFASENNIKDASIMFKVNSSWFKQMNVDPEDVKLQRYTGNAWEVMPTTLESNAMGIATFKAQTSGFSSFAITSERKPKAPKEIATQQTNSTVSMNSTALKAKASEETKAPGFEILVAVTGLLAAYSKRKQ
ncbi:PGF-pre-PGF domain-containing protein [uncultured Methanomethylovorans sp.]|uniref:PGF-pre-PGF domain-containing protein n=1 Tax=uncultured Methanomethylovorans sp. TaxID=183759 RepID=UPI002AA70C44|nr:PGF-pre-PGF domain-containing protein [uncultured Methanomethylovorans sp.]